jgi:hypothetical protein
MNYEPLLERDFDGIRKAIGEFRADHTSDELFHEIARFAVLAYAPSQHAKHAVIACISAHELRDHPSYDELLTECAIYAAASRPPWSEPPIADPPKEEPPEDASPRQRAEYWLAHHGNDANFSHQYFSTAAQDFEDLGHKLIVAVTAWKLAAIFGQQGRYAALRIGVWEMTAYEGRYEERGDALETQPLLERLIDNLDANDGDIVSAHAIFLLDAALSTEDEPVIHRVRDYLTSQWSAGAPAGERRRRGRRRSTGLRPDRFARDCGALLKMHAVAKRLRQRFPQIQTDRMVAAAQYNLEHAPSFEEYSFA